VKVRFAPFAQQRARHIKTWWQNHRPAAEVTFDQELEDLTRRLASMSSRSPLGVIDGDKHGQSIRRVLLRKSQQHVYYSIDEATDTVIVRMIWGAQRGQRPKL